MQTPRLRATWRAVLAGAVMLLAVGAVVPAGAGPAMADRGPRGHSAGMSDYAR